MRALKRYCGLGAIGRLGGHLNRKRDAMPGVRTLWRGLQALSLLVAGFRAGQRVLK